MKNTPLLTMALATAAAASVAPPTAAADQQTAEVGIVLADGSIHLYPERFRQTFANGLPVESIFVSTAPGSSTLMVTRKGHGEDGGCLLQSLPLWDGPDQLSTEDGPHPWHPVVVKSGPLLLGECVDNGCSEYWMAIFDDVEPYNENGYCDVTEFSDHKCRCHFPERPWLPGEPAAVLDDPAICKRTLQSRWLDHLDDWVLWELIDNG